MASITTATALPGASLGTRAQASQAAIPALIAIFLGLATIGIVGFAQIDVVHNAAHNTRHVNAFPCH